MLQNTQDVLDSLEGVKEQVAGGAAGGESAAAEAIGQQLPGLVQVRGLGWHVSACGRQMAMQGQLRIWFPHGDRSCDEFPMSQFASLSPVPWVPYLSLLVVVLG